MRKTRACLFTFVKAALTRRRRSQCTTTRRPELRTGLDIPRRIPVQFSFDDITRAQRR
jgi:hypothetical protein